MNDGGGYGEGDSGYSEKVLCTQGILWKRGRYGLFRLPWVERRFVLNNMTQKLYIGGGKNAIEVDMVGTQVKELEPNAANGYSHAFEVRYRRDLVDNHGKKTGTERGVVVARANTGGDKAYWVNALSGASSGSTLQEMAHQKNLEKYRTNIMALIEDGDFVQAYNEVDTAVRVVDKSLDEGSMAMAEQVRDLASLVAHPNLYNKSMVHKFKKKLVNAAATFIANGQLAHAIAVEISHIELMMVEEDYENAVKMLLSCLAVTQKREGLKNERSIAFMELLGQCYEATFDYREAIKILERAINVALRIFGTVHIKVAELTQKVGCVFMACYRHKNAKESFEIAHRIMSKVLGPRSRETIEAQTYLGMACLRLEDSEKAKKCLIGAEEWAIQSGDYKMAAVAQTNLAETHFFVHHFEGALQVVENGFFSCQQANLDVSALLLMKGLIYLGLNNDKLAVKYLKEASEANAGMADIVSLRQTLKIGQTFLGIRGMEDEGVELLEKALAAARELSPMCPIDWEIIASLADHTKKTDFKAAITGYQKALAIKKARGNCGLKYALLSMKLGGALLKFGDKVSSVPSFREAATIYISREHFKDAGLAYLKIGQIQIELQEYECALLTLEQARKAMEGNILLPYILYELANSSFMLKEFVNCVEQTSSALQSTLGKSSHRYLTTALLVLRGDCYMAQAQAQVAGLVEGQLGGLSVLEAIQSGESDYGMALIETRARRSDGKDNVETHQMEYVVDLLTEKYTPVDITNRREAAKKAEKAEQQAMRKNPKGVSSPDRSR